MSKKPLLCKNCKLYDIKRRVCTVVVYKEGEKYELATEPNDPCIYEKEGIAVQEIRAWSDGRDGFIQTTESFTHDK